MLVILQIWREVISISKQIQIILWVTYFHRKLTLYSVWKIVLTIYFLIPVSYFSVPYSDAKTTTTTNTRISLTHPWLLLCAHHDYFITWKKTHQCWPFMREIPWRDSLQNWCFICCSPKTFWTNSPVVVIRDGTAQLSQISRSPGNHIFFHFLHHCIKDVIIYSHASNWTAILRRAGLSFSCVL